MHDFRVPTVALAAEIQWVDGAVLSGSVFLAADSAVQAGPMLPNEWINGPATFFPFLQAQTGAAILVGKSSVLALSVAAPPDAVGEAPDLGLPVRRVVVEAGAARFEGSVVIDMPDHQRRLVDYLNRSEPFLALTAGNRLHFIRKACLSRVTEIAGT